MRIDFIGSIGDLVRTQARRYGEKPLWIQGDRISTYREYDERTDAVAAGLLRQGIQKGDRVATYLHNSITLLEAYTGIAKAGAVTVFVNSQLTPREIRYICQDSDARLIITDSDHLGNVQEVLEDCPTLERVIVAGDPGDFLSFESLATSPPVTLPAVAADDQAWVGYTSGTTGLPKGAGLTHRNVTWVAAACVDALRYSEDDRFVCCLPLFHSFAVNTCYAQPIYSGGTQVILDRFNTTLLVETIAKHKITVFPGVPTMFTYLAHMSDREKYDTSSLRIAVSAGAVLKEKVIADFESAFGVKIYDGWGSTETCSFATSTRVGGTQMSGSCGLPLPGCAVRVIDSEGHDCPPGERGEMCIRGPNVTWGYLNKPEVTASALKDGWYHTGDLAYLDPNGYVYVVDRLKDVINCGGYKITPKEIEDVLMLHPAVLEVAVVGIPDEARGESPKAFVILKEGAAATVADLEAHCRTQLAQYKLPRAVEVRSDLPKTSSGKIKRFELRQLSTQGS